MRLTQAGAIEVFTDVRSGRNMDRPGLQGLLAYARRGDTLAVVRLDRLGRSLGELLTTVTMLKERGIALLSLEEKIDTSSAAGELVFHVFGAIAHFERRLIAERTKDGIAAARAKGKHPGRQPLHPDRIAAALKLVDAGLSPTAAARQLGLGRSTVYRETAAAGLARTFHRAGALACVGISLWTLVGHTRQAQAQVTHICWIEDVRQTAQGVDIYFMKTKTRVSRNRAWEDMPLASITIDGKEIAYPHVSTVLGDELFLANSPEDGCSIKVAMQDGSIGVIANAYFNPPGLPRATSTQFIPAAPMKP